jgi:hypothetical protein
MRLRQRWLRFPQTIGRIASFSSIKQFLEFLNIIGMFKDRATDAVEILNAHKPSRNIVGKAPKTGLQKYCLIFR